MLLYPDICYMIDSNILIKSIYVYLYLIIIISLYIHPAANIAASKVPYWTIIERWGGWPCFMTRVGYPYHPGSAKNRCEAPCFTSMSASSLVWLNLSFAEMPKSEARCRSSTRTALRISDFWSSVILGISVKRGRKNLQNLPRYR